MSSIPTTYIKQSNADPKKKWTKYSTNRSNRNTMVFNGKGYRSVTFPLSLPFDPAITNMDTYKGIYLSGKRDTTTPITNSLGTIEKEGRYQWANGMEYLGGWKNGIFHGRGTLNWNANENYKGDFVEGKIEGDGILTMEDEKYTGSFTQGKRNGFGISYYTPSTRYDFANDEMALKTQYAGIWKEDYWNEQGFIKFDASYSPTNIQNPPLVPDAITQSLLFNHAASAKSIGDVYYGFHCPNLFDGNGAPLTLRHIAKPLSVVYKLRSGLVQDVYNSNNPLTRKILSGADTIENIGGSFYSAGDQFTNVYDTDGSILDISNIADIVNGTASIFQLSTEVQQKNFMLNIDVYDSVNSASRIKLDKDAMIINIGGALFTAGKIQNSKLHGFGSYSWANDIAFKRKRYAGNWQGNHRERAGILYLLNDDQYKGEYSLSKFHGSGTFTWQSDPWNRQSYTGAWKNGVWSGNGEILFCNDDRFSGVFAEGVSFVGKMDYRVDQMRYDGSFDNNFNFKSGPAFTDMGDGIITNYDYIRHGQGECVYRKLNRDFDQLLPAIQTALATLSWNVSQTTYKGSWTGDHWDGKGLLTFPNKDTYKGDFIAGRREGLGVANINDSLLFFGKIEYPSKLITYDGEWLTDMRHGQGKCEFGIDSIFYKGTWVKNIREGKGEFNSPEYHYDGDWKNDEFEGQGVCIYKMASNRYSTSTPLRSVTYVYPRVDPLPPVFYDLTKVPNPAFYSKYQGAFSRSMCHGKGTMQYASQDIYYEGDWMDNQRDGSGMFICPSYEHVGKWKSCVEPECSGHHTASHGCRHGSGKMIRKALPGSSLPNLERRAFFKYEWSRDQIIGDGTLVTYQVNMGVATIKSVYIGPVQYRDSETEDPWKPQGRGMMFLPTAPLGPTDHISQTQLLAESKVLGLTDEFVALPDIQFESIRVASPEIGKPFLASCDVRIGDFDKGKLEGPTTIYHANGDTFRGTHKEDKRIYGVHTSVNGDISVGTFKDDRLHGSGEHLSKPITAPNQLIMYVGEWEKGVRSGFGIQVTMKCSCSNVNDPIHHSIVRGSNGHALESIYVGYFTNNLKHGNGLLYRTCDRSRHIGVWNNDKESNEGIWVYPPVKGEPQLPAGKLEPLFMLLSEDPTILTIHTRTTESEFATIVNKVVISPNGDSLFTGTVLRDNSYAPSAIPSLNAMIQVKIDALILDARAVLADRSIAYKPMSDYNAFKGTYDSIDFYYGVAPQSPATLAQTGKGILYYANGNRYKGPVLHFEKHTNTTVPSGELKVYNELSTKYFNYKIYTGEYKNDLRDGKGTVVYRSHKDLFSGFTHLEDDKYIGAFEKDMRHGTGKLTFVQRVLTSAQKNRVKGEWKAAPPITLATTTISNLLFDEFNPNTIAPQVDILGFHEAFVETDQQWKHDKLDGPKVNHVAHDFSVYQGGYKAHVKDSDGKDATFLFPDGAKYIGQVKDGKMNGKGKYYYKCGDIYDGNFVDGVKSGRGIYTFATVTINGRNTNCTFNGEFLNGNRHGTGSWINKESYIDPVINRNVLRTETYDGKWVNGYRQDDKGVYVETIQEDPTAIPAGPVLNCRRYVGGFMAGKMTTGTMTYTCNCQNNPLIDIYVGSFVNEMRDGKGVMIYSDNVEYDGNWQADFMHGQGKLSDSSGVIEEGIYKFGEYKGILKSRNPDVYSIDMSTQWKRFNFKLKRGRKQVFG